MRLRTISGELSNLFLHSANIEEARALFEKVFWSSYGSLDDRLRQELEVEDVLSCLADHKVPSSGNLGKLYNEFDKQYFDLEDTGDLEASGDYFKKARITASMAQSAKAVSNIDFAEAAYEALMATHDPEAQATFLLS